jgi:TonB-dependent SusC/RagA subfamily outer membrane receptor
MLLSLTLPFLDLNLYTIEAPQNITVSNLATLIDQPANATINPEVFTWEKMFFVGLLSISTIFILLFVIGVFKIYQIKKRSKVTPLKDFDFIETEHEDAPFSFFKNLFWKIDLSIDDEQGKNIVRHELVHIKENHSWGKVFVELLCAQFWMNPFYWIIKRELEVIHEFIADEKTIENADPAMLATMLLESQYKGKFLNTGESYFYSSIKRRIIMLTNSKKPSYSYLRRVLILPITAGLILLSSFTINHFNKSTSKQNNKLTLLDIISLIDTTPKVKAVQGHPLQKEYLVSWSDSWVIFSDPKTKNEVFRMAKDQVVSPPPKTVKGHRIDSVYSLMDTLPALEGKKISATPLIIVNGVPVEKVNSIKSTDIETINVLKDPSSTALYGTKAANGVLLITTKNGVSQSSTSESSAGSKEIIVVGHPLQNDSKEVTVVGYGSKKESAQGEGNITTLITPDLVIAQKALEKNDVLTIDVSEKNGKKEYRVVQKSPSTSVKMPSNLKYILEGREITEAEMKEINPNEIETINVWKGENAKVKFGVTNGGVVEIHLKKK